MSITSSEFSVAESEGVPDGLHGSRRDTFSTESECFNRLDVFNLGTINVCDEIDDGSDYIEESSLSSATSEDEIEASVVSFESHSDEGSFVSRQNTQMHCCSTLMHNRRCNDSLGLLSISSMSSCETQIVHRAPLCNTFLNPPHAYSNSAEAAERSVSMDVHSDKEASSIESTSIGVSPVDSVDNSAENHVSLKKKVNNKICSFFKRAWNAVKHLSLCCETRVEPFVPSVDDTEPDGADSSCPAEPSGIKPTDDEGSLSSDSSEDDCDVIVYGPFSIQRRKLAQKLGEWSFNSANNHFIDEGGCDNSLDLLSISSDVSSIEERSGTWQNGPARETCACSDCKNMYATGPSMSLEEQSDEEAPPVDTVENSTEKHTSLRKKLLKGFSSFFKKTWKALKWTSFCCCETRVEPFVPLQEDSEPDLYPKPHFVAEPFGFKSTDDSLQFDYEMVMIESGSFGFL